MNKLCTLDELKSILSRINKKKITYGFTNGCFDLIHPGHFYLLEKCKSYCDLLIVGLNSDNSVRLLKGKNRPINDQNLRAKKLSYNKNVSYVVIFSEETPIKLIEAIKPNFLFKGKDYSEKYVVGSEFVVENGGEVILIDLLADYSTSKIIAEKKKYD